MKTHRHRWLPEGRGHGGEVKGKGVKYMVTEEDWILG